MLVRETADLMVARAPALATEICTAHTFFPHQLGFRDLGRNVLGQDHVPALRTMLQISPSVHLEASLSELSAR